MKKQIFIFAAILILSTTSAIYAQTNTIKADIPFDFSVKNKTYPAGDYVIEQLPIDRGQRMVWMLSNDEKQVVMLAMTKENADRTDNASVVFNRYGDQYFLSNFVTSSLKIALPTSRAERKLKRGTGEKLAKAVNPRIVEIEATIE